MDASERGERPPGAAGARDAAAGELEIPLRLVAERMLLSALSEQDAASAADAARRRAQFLADASLRFGASLDQELTYAAIAGLAAPGLDVWCIVDIVEVEGGLRRIAGVHPDEDKRSVARAVVARWMPAADQIGVPAVRRDRVPVIVTGRSGAAVAGPGDTDTQRVLRWLDAGSLLVVPIIAHDDLLGAITFVSRPDAPAYTPDDVRLAEALAARCAQALEGVRLYAAARASWADADAAHAEAKAAHAEAEAARAEAEAARAEAEAANATKADFLRTMSHELRTPLNAIGGYAELLQMGLRGPVTPAQRIDLASIQRSQAHLLGLVEAVLNYAQIEAGRMAYTTANVPLAQVVAGVQSFVAPQMRAKALTYAFKPSEMPLTVRADEEKVRQIVVNLVGNATKFAPPGGCITVTCGEAAPKAGAGDAGGPIMLAVRVTDTGVGIPADQLESIFDPFVQVDRRRKTTEVGVGLGLTISRDLARGMGGDVTVESTPGVGSTFTLTLPAASAESGAGA